MSHQDWIGRLLLDRYRPVRVLAEGGQGVVYLARTEGGVGGFVRPVVVKRILPQQAANANNTRLFLREAKLLSEMSHPNILGIVDLAQVDGEYIMVLEYVRGSNVGKWARFRRQKHGSVPWEFAAHVGAVVADALHHVHTRTDADGTPYSVVHRDVTPANILVDVSGAVKLADFGIARRDGDKTEQISGADVVRGNFSFVSPEIFVGDRPTASADVYSLGMVLHWMISGEQVQKGENLNQTVYRALYVEPERLDAGRPDVPTAFADVVAEAVAKDPLRRLSDASEFSARLRALLPPDVAARFAEVVAADMEADDFATTTRTPPLRELDASWRDFTPTSTPTPRPTSSSLAPAAESPRRSMLWGGLVGALAVGSVGGGVALYTRTAAPETPREVILVRGDVAPVATAAHEAGADPRDTPRPPAPEAVAAPPEPTDAPAPFSSRVLTQTFADRRGAVQQCAARHLEVESLDVSIFFDAGADGVVRDVALSPRSIHGTPLGACLTSVARETQFGPLPRPLSFTIPVTVRRGE